MLDGYIIEELRRREAERQRQERQRPQVQIPLHDDDECADRAAEPEQEPSKSGSTVITIDL
jgi:hypothetical protein